MTNYPNSGDRPGGIGENVEDLRRTGSTQDLTSAEELVPPSTSKNLEASTRRENALASVPSRTTSSGYAGSATPKGRGHQGRADPPGPIRRRTWPSRRPPTSRTPRSRPGRMWRAQPRKRPAMSSGRPPPGPQPVDQLRSDVREQGSGQKDKIASTLHSLSQELGSMASKSEEDGPVTDLARQASRRGGEIAHWLDDHDAGDALEEVKRYARRHPFTFLAICAAAGVVVGRLGRGAVAANTSLDSPDSSSADRALGSG